MLTLNRGDNRNSMTPELLDAFLEQSVKLAANPPRCVIISGKGACFSAGADFKSVTQRTAQGRLPHQASLAMYEPFLSVLDIPVPVIGALNGHAVGGGFGLSLVCDIRIANSGSKYGANFTKLGLSPGLGISFLLPRIIGQSKAAELLYSGRLVLGDEACDMGLVSSAHPSAEAVIEHALKLATDIAASAPTAVRLSKELLRSNLPAQIREAATREAYAQAETLKLSDAKEGVAALLEHRPPVF